MRWSSESLAPKNRRGNLLYRRDERYTLCADAESINHISLVCVCVCTAHALIEWFACVRTESASQFVNMSLLSVNQLSQYDARNAHDADVNVNVFCISYFCFFVLCVSFSHFIRQQSIEKSMETVIVISAG